MYYVVLVILFFLPSFSAHAQNFNQTCNDIHSVLTVKYENNEKIKITHSLSVKEISKTVSARKGLTWGTTVPLYIINKDITAEIIEDKNNNSFCFSPSMEINILIEEFEISIAKEVKKDSCIYNEIFNHEIHHVKIYRDNFELMVNNLKNKLEIKLLTKYIGSDYQKLSTQINDDLTSFIEKELKGQLLLIGYQHLKFDSQEESERVGKACDKALSKIN